VLGHQEPQTHHVAGDLLGKQLPDVTLDVDWIDFFVPILFAGAEGLDLLGLAIRSILVEFFFEGRTER
jgi:hypothetical protein